MVDILFPIVQQPFIMEFFHEIVEGEHIEALLSHPIPVCQQRVLQTARNACDMILGVEALLIMEE